MWSWLRTSTPAVRVQLLLGRNTYLLFNSNVGNLVWKTTEGWRQEALFWFFYYGSALIVGGWGLVWRDRRFHSYFRSWCYSRKWGRGVSPALPLFSLFQEAFTITEVMKEIFEVNVNEHIESMDLFEFTQDTSSASVLLKNHRLYPPY